MKSTVFIQNESGAICMSFNGEAVELTYDQVKTYVDLSTIEPFDELMFCRCYRVPGKYVIKLDELVAREFNTTTENMYSGSKSRSTGAVASRQMYMKLLKEHTKRSLAGIGMLVKTPLSPNGMSHANVIHAINTVQNDIDTNKHYKKIYDFINEEIKQKRVLIP